MALRWRDNGRLVCAAKSNPQPNDTYISDRLQYRLSVELKVIAPNSRR